MVTEPTRTNLSLEKREKAKQEGLLADQILSKQHKAVEGFSEFKPRGPSAGEGGGQLKESLTPAQINAIQKVAGERGVSLGSDASLDVERDQAKIALLNQLIGQNGGIQPGTEFDVLNTIMGTPDIKQ